MAVQRAADVAPIFETPEGLVAPPEDLHVPYVPVYGYADSLAIPLLTANERALSGYPPSHPFEYVLSQSTNYYGERLSETFLVTLQNPSMAAAAEKAQQDPQLP